MSITLFSEYIKYDIKLGLYPDNTPNVDLNYAWNDAAGQFTAILVRPNNMQEFFTAMMIVDSIKERGGYVNDLILPCIPGQRQDRMKWEGDWLMTLKFVAKTINSMNFKRVVALDPHSLASGMIDRLMVPVLNVGRILTDMERTYDGVIAPDAGAAARAGQVAKDLGVPLIQASKHRDPETNKLSGFKVEGLKEFGNYLVVDDLCDGGGTFMGLAEAAFGASGVTLDLFVTHGIFSKNAAHKLRKVYTNIYSTNSIPGAHFGVTYIFNTEGLVR